MKNYCQNPLCYLYDTKDYSGASGTFSISEEGSAIKSRVFKEVKEGQYIPLE